MLGEISRSLGASLSPQDRFKRGDIGEEEYAALVSGAPEKHVVRVGVYKEEINRFASPEDLVRGGWIPSQQEISYFVGRKPPGQVATIEDLMGMISIGIAGRKDLNRANLLGRLGVNVIPRPMVSEGLASAKRTEVLSGVPVVSLN